MSVDLVGLAEQAQAVSLAHTKPRVAAVFEFLREEILSAAADGHLHMELSVSDHWYHDTVNQKLVVALLATEGVRASFESGTWFLDWRDEQ